MVYDYKYTNVYHQPFVTGSKRPDYEAYFDLLHRALDTFDQLFERDDGGITLQRQGAEVLRRALQRVADAHGVQSVWVGISPLDDHVGLYGDESVNWDVFDQSYKVIMNQKQQHAAREYVSQVRERQSVIGGANSQSSFNILKNAIPTFDQARRLLSSEADTKWRINRWIRYNARQFGKHLKGRIANKLYLDQEPSR